MTEIMPVPRNLILLSYQQGAFFPSFLFYHHFIKNLQEDLILYHASSTRYQSTQYNRTRVDGLNQPVVL